MSPCEECGRLCSDDDLDECPYCGIDLCPMDYMKHVISHKEHKEEQLRKK